MVERTFSAAKLVQRCMKSPLTLKCPHMTHITTHMLRGGAWQSGWLSHWFPRWLKLFQLSSMLNFKFFFLQCPLCSKICNDRVLSTYAPKMRSLGLLSHVYRGIVYCAPVFIVWTLWIHSVSGLSPVAQGLDSCLLPDWLKPSSATHSEPLPFPLHIQHFGL